MNPRRLGKDKSRVTARIVREFHKRVFGEQAARIHFLPVNQRIRHMQRLRKVAKSKLLQPL